MSKFTAFVFFLCVISFNSLLAQHEERQPDAAHHEGHYKNEISIYCGSTYLTKSGFNIPTIGIDYSRQLNSFLSIAALADFELGSHIIEHDNNGDIHEVERERALLLMPGLSFRVVKGLTLFAGYGVEIEKTESLGLLRLGAGYKMKLKSERWLVEPYFYWERTKLFNALAYGVVFGYEFGK